jgi:U2-associated protein SR140
VRKSKREKEKEVAEAKRKEEEENAAKAYAEFIDAFEGEEVQTKRGGSAFVRSSKEEGREYAPSAARSSTTSRSMRAFEKSRVRRPNIHGCNAVII